MSARDDAPDGLPYPTITPYLFYPDPAAAIRWLADAFGFVHRLRLDGPDGGIAHAEMATGVNGVVMFGSPDDGYGSPRGGASRAMSLYVKVSDLDAHADRARRAGARIVVEPVDRPWGDREYAVEDFEGHLWIFWERLVTG